MTWFKENLGLYEWLELERGQLSATFQKIIISCAHLFIHSSKDDNFNIGFIFLFIGKAAYFYTYTTQSRVLQAYWLLLKNSEMTTLYITCHC